MAAGYLIAEIEVSDPEAYKAYVAAVSPVVAQFGGEYLVRGGKAEVVEGAAQGSRVVVIRFPSVAAAREWYHSDAYAPAKALRHAASTSVQIIAEGV